FKQFLRKGVKVQSIENRDDIFTCKLNDEEAVAMIVEVSNDEIKKVMLDIADTKALGHDVFTACFFKKAWSVVRNDVCDVVKEFFINKKLLKEVNATIISLDTTYGFKMFQLVKKLKGIKRVLNDLNWKNGNMFDKTALLKDKVKEWQCKIDRDPHNIANKKEGVSILKEYKEALLDEGKLLLQKTKTEWLKEADKNTAYFRKIL
nr:RNA-directed DNA polymerase, eukaryota, reverse transcriptase zinc-binding domain protein [Tanacetum cinerariifolium]